MERFKEVADKEALRCFMVGQTGSGKTYGVVNRLFGEDCLGGYYHTIIVLAPTDINRKAFSKIKLKKGGNMWFFMGEYDWGELTANLLMLLEGMKPPKDKPVCIIVDDLFTEKEITNTGSKKTPIERLFIRGRQLNVSVIFLSQSYVGGSVNELIRATNLNALCLFRVNRRDIKKIADDHCPPLMHPKEIEQHLLEEMGDESDPYPMWTMFRDKPAKRENFLIKLDSSKQKTTKT